jgi:serine/threonine protein kinase
MGLRNVEAKRRKKALLSVQRRIEDLQDAGRYQVFSTGTDGILYDAAQERGADARPDLHEIGLDSVTLGDIFHVGELLGTGSAGVVRGCTLKSDARRKLAVKVLSKRGVWWMTNQERRTETSLREVSILQSISEQAIPGCTRIFAAIETPSHLYLAMDLCTGGDLLSNMLDHAKPYTEMRTAHVMRGLARTVAGLHRLGIVHRDLKLENVLFKSKSEASEVELIDFGLSNTLNGVAMLRSCVGTNLFMAPEVFTKDEDTGKRGYREQVDIWGIGVIMFSMLSNQLPFPVDKDKDKLRESIAEGVTFKPEKWGGISEEAKALLESLLQLDPMDRPTAQELLKSEWVQVNAAKHDALFQPFEDDGPLEIGARPEYPSLSERITDKLLGVFCLGKHRKLAPKREFELYAPSEDEASPVSSADDGLDGRVRHGCGAAEEELGWKTVAGERRKSKEVVGQQANGFHRAANGSTKDAEDTTERVAEPASVVDPVVFSNDLRQRSPRPIAPSPTSMWNPLEREHGINVGDPATSESSEEEQSPRAGEHLSFESSDSTSQVLSDDKLQRNARREATVRRAAGWSGAGSGSAMKRVGSRHQAIRDGVTRGLRGDATSGVVVGDVRVEPCKAVQPRKTKLAAISPRSLRNHDRSESATTGDSYAE